MKDDPGNETSCSSDVVRCSAYDAICASQVLYVQSTQNPHQCLNKTGFTCKHLVVLSGEDKRVYYAWTASQYSVAVTKFDDSAAEPEDLYAVLDNDFVFEIPRGTCNGSLTVNTLVSSDYVRVLADACAVWLVRNASTQSADWTYVQHSWQVWTSARDEGAYTLNRFERGSLGLSLEPGDACPVGSVRETPGDARCVQCPVGSFTPEYGTQECAQCPAPKTTIFEGAHLVSACVCPPGTFVDGADCPACTAGAYNPWHGASSCLSCREPSENRTTCLCPAGKYYDVDQGRCRECVPGAYSETQGATACSLCPTDMTTLGPGSNNASLCVCAGGFESNNGQCTQCASGKFSRPGQPCEPCPQGTFAAAHAASRCLPCPYGYNSSTDQTTCEKMQGVPARPPDANYQNARWYESQLDILNGRRPG